MARAARRPAPIAEMTVAPPVTMSPPANTPCFVVAPVVGSAMMYPERDTATSGVVERISGFAPCPRPDGIEASSTSAPLIDPGEKGNLRFPIDQKIPYALIARIVKFKAKRSR